MEYTAVEYTAVEYTSELQCLFEALTNLAITLSVITGSRRDLVISLPSLATKSVEMHLHYSDGLYYCYRLRGRPKFKKWRRWRGVFEPQLQNVLNEPSESEAVLCYAYALKGIETMYRCNL